ncbi:uncharacterized protein PAN0_003c1493 [Moesziomyces antarcticus]|uniref:Related to Dik6, novel virulence factor n=1 Tax=Pseudozyma antarctica TaxID=84753 RepID=A0A5C3FK16_PSEA2|nr:uncharacterized protein PAN0_003c1493 [Moesziomyces antarcticus]GAK63289.1 conserved hypothetical protein [Moesziomyces antarcticus]SPO43871.1 related to Dik6, novel virulence factor [Moesziomyces antarcticus]
MNASQYLDLPYTVASLHRRTDPQSMAFLHRGLTQDQVLVALAHTIYQPVPSRMRVYLCANQFEVVLTLIVCGIMIIQKRSYSDVWLIARRRSAYGTFYVANALVTLIIAVALYLFAWGIACVFNVTYSFAKLSALEWWWSIPLPWYPLLAGSYISMHGFILGCSPASPLSINSGSNSSNGRRKWYFLGVPKSPLVVNLALFVPLVVFTITTFTLVGFSGTSYYHAKRLSHQSLPASFHSHLQEAAFEPHRFGNDSTLASDELIWHARVVAAAYIESHRYVCINLAFFAASAILLWIPCIAYGTPNLLVLVEHACSRCPDPLPSTCNSYLRKLWFLVTKGKPTSEKSTVHHNLATWKMTFLAHIYVWILIFCVPAYAWIPMYIVGTAYPHVALTGDIVLTWQVAIYAASVVTTISCTSIAIFSTVATLDPVFRAAIGFNVIRNNQPPIDITVTQRKSVHEDISPPFATVAGENPQAYSFKEILGSRDSRTVGLKPSASTFRSLNVSSDPPAYPYSSDSAISQPEIHVDYYPGSHSPA